MTVSGCFSDPSKPSKSAKTSTTQPGWVSVETTTKAPELVIEKVTYRSGDLDIEGQVCRPAGNEPHPVLISNHGGFGGLVDWNSQKGFCALAAKAGWVLAESSYRGEDGSDGRVEVCLGEVDDVLAMLDVVRAKSYADPDRIAMLGVSHGGCITSRAIERGADIQLAVEISGPADWASSLRTVKRSMKGPSTNPQMRAIQKSTVKEVEKVVGGTPAQYPERYAKRSPDTEKIAQWDKPFLIMHGVADTIVPVEQSCDLARKIGGFKAYRFDTSGGVRSDAPAGCQGLTWEGPPSPVRSFNADRYLFTYDGVDHFLVANNGLARMTSDFLGFLAAKLPVA
jgi:dipeptidyl aminopeptidase/acylaminoacyl peptidase